MTIIIGIDELRELDMGATEASVTVSGSCIYVDVLNAHEETRA